MRKPSLVGSILFLSQAALCADVVPSLQWFAALGGSGASTVTGAVADSTGNLYVVGNTTSLDFPVTAPAQRASGGTTLARTDIATGVLQKLQPAGLSVATSLAADPKNPQSLYATAANAIWHSSDAGATWSLLWQFASGVTANFMAVDPSNGSTLYAATSQGPFQSSDGGLTWVSIANGLAAVSRVWVDPKSPRVLFAFASTGLLRSADAGASWTPVNASFRNAKALAFDSLTPGTLYVGLGTAIAKSTDDGKTFTALPALSSSQADVIALAADSQHSGVLYAATSAGIYRRADSGATWSQQTTAVFALLAADPDKSVVYASKMSLSCTYGLIRSADGFATSSSFGGSLPTLQQVLVAGAYVFEVASPTNDVFAAKFDSGGNVVYSTYLGGSGEDSAAGVALAADGSLYIAGVTSSLDFPTTAGAYLTAPPYSTVGSNFVCKPNADGSLGWSTYFADTASTLNAIALDSTGAVYIGGTTDGDLPTTAGAYQTKFERVCISTWLGPGFCGPSSAFVTKLNAKGSGLVYSTYVPTDNNGVTLAGAQSLAVDPSGRVYFGGAGNVALLNASGSALLASAQATRTGEMSIAAVALDAGSNLYATGTWTNYSSGGGFPATSSAYQTGPRPGFASLSGELPPGGGQDAFVMKWDSGLTQVLAATLLGGELADNGESIAFDGSGDVVVSGATDSKTFPTRAPFQTSFSARAGFVAGLDSNLSRLLFATFLGDSRAFDARAVALDGIGNILLAGSTLTAAGAFIGGDPGLSYTGGGLAVVNKIALPQVPAVRLDSVVNYASRVAAPLAPGETVAALGAGFGADAQILADGVAIPLMWRDSAILVGTMPDSAKTSGSFRMQVSSGGSVSNAVLAPAAAAAPEIYSVDGSGYNQGYILNADGTLNSPSNPAAPGSAITIYATGVGAYTTSGGFAVTALQPAVFIDGFYANGIAAAMGPAGGLPGNVYQLGVYAPDPAMLAIQNPDLSTFKLPAQAAVRLVMGPVNPSNPNNSSMLSQGGIVLCVRQ